jgi:hypothetical protein
MPARALGTFERLAAKHDALVGRSMQAMMLKFGGFRDFPEGGNGLLAMLWDYIARRSLPTFARVACAPGRK